MPIAQPDPNAATSMPATENPSATAVFWPIRRSEIAADSCSGGTVCWVIACELGRPRADTHPATAPSRPNSHTLDHPPMRLAAVSAWTRALTVFEPCSITARETRSPSTPPKSVVATSAAENAATTRPSWVAEPPRSSTANASATGVMPPPKEFTVCAVTSRRYDGLASGPRQRDRGFVTVTDTGADYFAAGLAHWIDIPFDDQIEAATVRIVRLHCYLDETTRAALGSIRRNLRPGQPNFFTKSVSRGGTGGGSWGRKCRCRLTGFWSWMAGRSTSTTPRRSSTWWSRCTRPGS